MLCVCAGVLATDLGAGQPAHDEALVLQSVVVLLIIGCCLGPAGPLEPSKGSSAGLGVEGVHHDGFRAFDLAAAERTALTLRLLAHKHWGKVRAAAGERSCSRGIRGHSRTDLLIGRKPCMAIGALIKKLMSRCATA